MSLAQGLLYAAAAAGVLFIGKYVGSLAFCLFNAYLIPGKSLKKYGAGNPKAWAIVTGASDGIGKEFALQLAKAKFNIVLLARTESKLHAVAEEAKKLSPSIKTVVQPFDFANADNGKYDALAKTIQGLTEDGGFVGVLVNNVGVNHDIPFRSWRNPTRSFRILFKSTFSAQLKLTRIVAPLMISANAASRSSSLILNI
ncbi:hypothetical protein BC829DRAFT_427354, partial [Chytridium lagenaria]